MRKHGTQSYWPTSRPGGIGSQGCRRTEPLQGLCYGTAASGGPMSPREGAALRLLTPSVLLPAQMASPRADRWLRRLCRAILEDALACLEGKGPPSTMGSARDGARRAGHAWQWFESEATYLFSFTTVCAV